MNLARTELIARLMANAGVCLIEAIAGSGKSVLLDQLGAALGIRICRATRPRIADVSDGWLLWDPDLPDMPVLTPETEAAATRIVVARRPGRRMQGLSRRMLYGPVLRLGTEDLVFGSEDLATLSLPVHERFAALAAWPAMLPFARGDASFDDAAAFLAETIPLQDLLHPSADTLPAAFAADPARFPELRALVSAAAASLPLAPVDLREAADTLAARGEALAALHLLLDRGDEDHAARILDRAQGRELIYRIGTQAFETVVGRFGPGAPSRHEGLLLCTCRVLLKQGEQSRARQLLARHLGQDYLDPAKVFARGAPWSFDARSFRLNLLISEDMYPTDDLIARLMIFRAEYPLGDYAKWTAFYNAILEFENRRGRARAAEAAAAKALLYLRKLGQNPLLEFFIHLHLVVLRLMTGSTLHARQPARDARAALAAVPHPTEGEDRMLRLAEACLAYEGGSPGDLALFVERDYHAFAAGELWPSLMRFALFYASQSRGDTSGIAIRPGFLDDLWLHMADAFSLRTMMELRHATLLQNEGRRLEAADTLLALRQPIGRTWIEAAMEALSKLTGEELAYACAWLRQAADDPVIRPFLDRQLAHLVANPAMTHRQRIAAQIWLAHVQRRQRNRTAARATLMSALTTVARLGCNGVLSEERVFLSALISDRHISDFLDTSAEVRATLRIFTQVIRTPAAQASKGGLSGREVQLLRLIGEGLSNKRIAYALSISEVTVKFHLGNLYRKLGCANRKEAIRSATALGWL